MSRVIFQISNLSLSYGPQVLFNEVSLSIHQGDKLALIGENGAGKTTLLNIVSGSLQPDGVKKQTTDNIKIGFLPQEITDFKPAQTAKNYILEGPLFQLEKHLSELSEKLDNADKLAEWSELHEEFEKQGGYRRPPIEELLKGLKLNFMLDMPMSKLSGGQRIRTALAKALYQEPDLLLLDEPTNHLDEEMLSWLKETLSNFKGAIVLISHDRKFLNECCYKLIEIKDYHLTSYNGNYDFYLEEQERILERKMKAFNDQEDEKRLLKQKIKEMSFSKGKATAPKDKNVMAYDKRGEKHQKSVQRTLNDLKSRLTEIEADSLQNPKPKNICGLRFQPLPLLSHTLIELQEVCKAYGENQLFSNISFTLHKGERIIITGANGSGKSTLLECTTKKILPDSGEVRWTPSVKIGYLDQEIKMLPMNQSPLEFFEENYLLNEKDLRSEMHKAGLGGTELLRRPFHQLSVGQRKRLMLLSLILSKANVLILDEPTNHLDLLTLEALEKALLQFEGGVIAVSHDQTFIKKVATSVLNLSTGI